MGKIAFSCAEKPKKTEVKMGNFVLREKTASYKKNIKKQAKRKVLFTKTSKKRLKNKNNRPQKAKNVTKSKKTHPQKEEKPR